MTYRNKIKNSLQELEKLSDKKSLSTNDVIEAKKILKQLSMFWYGILNYYDKKAISKAFLKKLSMEGLRELQVFSLN
jgi:hypothetical protein